MAFHLSSSFVLSQFDNGTRTADALEEPVAAGGDGDKHDPDEITGFDPIFVPLGLPYLRDGEFYAVSDPEWKQFVRISQDQEKLKSLRGKCVRKAFWLARTYSCDRRISVTCFI